MVSPALAGGGVEFVQPFGNERLYTVNLFIGYARALCFLYVGSRPAAANTNVV
jgi:hypothetical protein